MWILFTIGLLLVAVLVTKSYYDNKLVGIIAERHLQELDLQETETDLRLKTEIADKLKADIEQLANELKVQVELNKNLVSQRASIATKSGNYFEMLSPITSAFPVDIYSPNVSIRWLGEMTDYIAVDYENAAIYFIEIKNGGARLSKRQQIIKKIVQEQGRIEFIEVRLNSDGTFETK